MLIHLFFFASTFSVVSGILLGQTGSYIFSQTLFTYRTGCHTRWVGVLCAIFFLSTVFSSVNFLEITPLFFLGSTLVFLGTDLLFIWLVEVRHKVSCIDPQGFHRLNFYLYFCHWSFKATAIRVRCITNDFRSDTNCRYRCWYYCWGDCRCHRLRRYEC